MGAEEDVRQAFEEGEQLREEHEYAAALAAFDRAIALKPDFAMAWLHRGLCLTELKRYEEAVASIERSLRYKPASAWTWAFHGDALFQMGKHLQALDSFDQAIQLQGGDFPRVWELKNAALKIIQEMLKKHRLLPPQPHLEAYELVRSVEERLHMFIQQRLKRAFGQEETEWWYKGVPQPVRKKCADRREEDPQRRTVYNYTDLIDLKDIIDKNWRHFEDDFLKAQMPKRDFLDGLGRLNEIRKTVMHPVRGNLTEADLTHAQQMKAVVESVWPSG